MKRKEYLEKTIDFDDAIARIVRLEKEAEPREKRIEQLEKENAELKADNDARKFAMAMSEKVEKQLRNERNTFLAQNEQYEKDLIDFNDKLTKAKEIIKILLKYDRGQFFDDRRIYEKYMRTRGEAEQFLKDSQQEE